MTSLVSAISGHFSRGLLLGTLIPVVTFTVIGGLLIGSWLPFTPPAVQALQSLGPEWQAAALVLATAVLAGLLWNCNVPLTRLYEGYSWQQSWIGRLRVSRHRATAEALSARWRGLRTLRYALEATPLPGSTAEQQAQQQDDLSGEHSRIGRELRRQFPPLGLILPTRLGNVIRAFETYPEQQYEMSAIPLWPRLLAVVDKDYAAAIDEQRMSFDFMLNCSALCALAAGTLTIAGLVFPLPFARGAWLLQWIAEIVCFVVAMRFFYEGAIGRAAAWGDTVKGAFDLYRHGLLKQLGFAALPATIEDERRMWRSISQQIIFGDTRRVILPPLTPSPTVAIVEPRWLRVEIHRGVEVPDAHGVQHVHLTLTNVDASGVPATRIIVRDQLAANVEFVHGSLQPPATRVTGSNPLQFTIGPLASGASVSLSFDVLRHKD